jgi:hypothetical protein
LRILLFSSISFSMILRSDEPASSCEYCVMFSYGAQACRNTGLSANFFCPQATSSLQLG